MLEFKHGRIKELREAMGIELPEMATKLNKTRQQVSIWESGVNSPSVENLLLICNTFDVDVSFFFDKVKNH